MERKKKEVVYDCVNGKKVRHIEMLYRKDGTRERTVRYFDYCDSPEGCIVQRFNGIDGTRPLTDTLYDVYKTKYSETFYNQGSKVKDLFPQDGAYKKVIYYEDGVTPYQETFYRKNPNDISVEDYSHFYYENGKRYYDGKTKTFYNPDGTVMKREDKVVRRADGGIEREIEWQASVYSDSSHTTSYRQNNTVEKIVIKKNVIIGAVL